MNRGRNTAILAVLAAALGAYLFFVERHRDAPAADAPDSPRGKVFDKLDAAKIEEIQIAAASGETTTLRKVDNAWRLTAPIAVPADQTEASSAASNLATADVQSVVDEQPKDLAAFGLAKPRVTITFRVAGDKTPRTLLLGDKNPTGSDLYAKLPDAPRVFLVSAYLEGTFDKGSFGFRDKRDPHLRSREDRSAGRRRRNGEDDGGPAVGHVERRRAGQRARRLRRHRSGPQPARQRPDEEHRLGSGRPGRGTPRRPPRPRAATP